MISDRGIYNLKIDPSKRYFKYKKRVIRLLATVVILACSIPIIFFINKVINRTAIQKYTDEPKIAEATMVQVNSTKPSSTKKTQSGYITEEIFDKLYKRYVDTEYNFYCAIPATYTAGESIGSGNRIVFVSLDSKTLLFIGAVPNKLNLSANELMKQYMAEFGDKVDYKANGKSWYAVSKTNDNVYYYRKCFVNDDFILWFEFNVKDGNKEPVGTYIDYIEDNFKMTR